MEQTSASQERCKHNIKKIFCGVCRAPESQPKATRVSPPSGCSYVVTERDERFFVIASRGELDKWILENEATRVHFVGFPSFEVVRKILQKFSGLRVLNFAPCHKRYLEANLGQYRSFLMNRNVELQFERVTGRYASTVEDRYTDKRWLSLKSRYFNLTPEQKLKLKELEELGFDEIAALKWYLLVDDYLDHQRISLLDVARLLGQRRANEGWRMIQSVLGYLDSQEPKDKNIKYFTKRFAKRVEEKKKTLTGRAK